MTVNPRESREKMSSQDQIHYHQQRALAELDLGLIAGTMEAARAHLKLSSLHMQKMHRLQGVSAQAKPPCIM